MSQILFLGTGAADWIIAERGDFFRRFSAALINDDLLIDCGEHILDYPKTSGQPRIYDAVTDIIITHRHRDHFCRENVLELAKTRRLRIGANREIANSIGGNPNIEFIILEPYRPQAVGRYTVTPLLANHDVVIDGDMRAYHYIIQMPDGKCVFYGLDGAWFLCPSWEEMKKHKFDVMVFDCTVGDFDDWRMFEHNTIPMLRTMIKEVRAKELVAESGKLVASHMARSLHGSHEETAKILKEIGVLAAFDGMEIKF